jgi:hypothetical protein
MSSDVSLDALQEKSNVEVWKWWKWALIALVEDFLMPCEFFRASEFFVCLSTGTIRN